MRLALLVDVGLLCIERRLNATKKCQNLKAQNRGESTNSFLTTDGQDEMDRMNTNWFCRKKAQT
jgi:hypothetical protein